MLTRRNFAKLLTLPLDKMRGQGVSTRNVVAAPRGNASGLPFRAKFTDIAAHAGLTAPTIYGERAHKEYILETVGCGCAFIDYDQDGWVDILILNGTRLENPPQSSNHLYKNQRDGTFV